VSPWVVVALREMYLMPGETVIQQRDMSRELIFVRTGALELLKNSQLIKTVRADSDLPSVVGRCRLKPADPPRVQSAFAS
jgi:hypothetical protein